MPKLDSYMESCGRDCGNIIVQPNLSRMQCSLLAKLATGTLLLEVETGRYERKFDAEKGVFMKTKREDRLCTIYSEKVVSNDYHILFDCPSLQTERLAFYVEFIRDTGSIS